MRILKLLQCVTLVAIFSNVSCMKRKFNSVAQNDSVEIPMTSVKNQGKSGFCGSFAMAAFVEGIAAQHIGHKVELSEMFSAYYVMAWRMYLMNKHIINLPENEKKKEYAQLVTDLNNPKNYVFFQGSNFHNLLVVLNNYGIVPKEKYLLG